MGKDGTIVQSVPDGKRAWHAGESVFAGQSDVNDFSLGIEIVNRGDNQDPYTDAQYASLINLVAYLSDTYHVPLDRLTGHRNVAIPKGRKTDPSDSFDWGRVRRGVETKLKGAGASAPAPAPARPAPQPAPAIGREGATTYRVKSGDSLSLIARDVLGDMNRWPEIYALNRNQLSNPNVIYPGMVLNLPQQTPANQEAPAKPKAPVKQVQPAPVSSTQPSGSGSHEHVAMATLFTQLHALATGGQLPTSASTVLPIGAALTDLSPLSA